MLEIKNKPYYDADDRAIDKDIKLRRLLRRSRGYGLSSSLSSDNNMEKLIL